jgi:hypothetical protein
MGKASKEERKRLKQQYKEAQRTADSNQVVVAESATYEKIPPNVIVETARTLRVNLEVAHESEMHFVLRAPGGPAHVRCELRYGTVDDDLAGILAQVPDFDDELHPPPRGANCITASTKPKVHPANALILLTVLRVLGRLTHGVLYDLANERIQDDWTIWSSDFVDTDMFEARLTGDDPTRLLAELPQLRFEPSNWQN